MTGKAKVIKARLTREQTSSAIQAFQDTVDLKREEVNEAQSIYISKREELVRCSAETLARRRVLVSQLQSIFPVVGSLKTPSKCSPHMTILSVHLPPAENFQGHPEGDLGVGLGYVVQVLWVLSRVLDVSLRYPLSFCSSRSAISDPISPKLSANERLVPLFLKGQDRHAFEYAVFLLNKNVAQLRMYASLSTPDLRQTLVNLQTLLQTLCESKHGVVPVQRPLAIPVQHRSLPSLSSASDSSSEEAGRLRHPAHSERPQLLLGIPQSPSPHPFVQHLMA